MKRLSSIIAILLAMPAGFAQHKATIGSDIGGLISTSKLNICAEYAFKEKWSLSWKADIDLGCFRCRGNPEQEAHLNEFAEQEKAYTSEQDFSASIRYWKDRAYDGGYLEAGLRCSEDMGTDCTIGIGYCIPIWKGLISAISYRTGIIRSIRNRRPSGEGLTIGIFWIINI